MKMATSTSASAGSKALIGVGNTVLILLQKESLLNVHPIKR
jgi:hypothetical protein